MNGLFQTRCGAVGERAVVGRPFQVREGLDRELRHKDSVRRDLRLFLERSALLRRPFQDVAGLQVIRNKRPVLSDSVEEFLLRDPGDLLDRLRVETQSLHRLNPGLEVLQRFLIFAEPFVKGDSDGLGPPRGLNRLRVLVCAEELLRDLERVLRGLDVRHRQSQDGDESLCVPNRFLRMTRLRRLQEADPRDLVVEHVILPLEETRSDHTWRTLAKPVGCRIH